MSGETPRVPAEAAGRTVKQPAIPLSETVRYCEFCGATLLWSDERGYWECPNCGAALLPPEPKEPDEFRTVGELWQDEQSYKRSLSKPGGGARTGRKRRTKKGRKRRSRAEFRLDIDG